MTIFRRVVCVAHKTHLGNVPVFFAKGDRILVHSLISEEGSEFPIPLWMRNTFLVKLMLTDINVRNFTFTAIFYHLFVDNRSKYDWHFKQEREREREWKSEWERDKERGGMFVYIALVLFLISIGLFSTGRSKHSVCPRWVLYAFVQTHTILVTCALWQSHTF